MDSLEELSAASESKSELETHTGDDSLITVLTVVRNLLGAGDLNLNSFLLRKARLEPFLVAGFDQTHTFVSRRLRPPL